MKKLYMIMIIFFSIMIYSDVYAVRYSNAQVTGGTSLGNGMRRIMVNAQLPPPDSSKFGKVKVVWSTNQ